MFEQVKKIEVPDEKILEKARQRVDNLIKPPGSLGDLEEIYIKMAGIRRDLFPEIGKRAMVVMAGDHKIIEEGVATSGKDITMSQVHNMTRGLTGVCALSKQARADLFVVDVGVDGEVNNQKVIHEKVKYGADNFTKGSAMTREEAVKSLEVGMKVAFDLIDKGYDIIGTGEMGIGNTTPSAAITAVITGTPVKDVTGVGANLPTARLQNKINVIEKGIAFNNPDKKDGVDVLSKVGGLEIGGMAGIMLGCAVKKVPVVVDGFISMAAALIACTINPASKEYMVTSHGSMERGAVIAANHLGFKYYLNLSMRLGEGTGAAIMLNVIDAACHMNKHMITFEEAGFIVD